VSDDTLTDLRAKLRTALVEPIHAALHGGENPHTAWDRCPLRDQADAIVSAVAPVLADCAAEIQRLTEALATAERARDEARAAEKRCIQASVQVVTRAPLTNADARSVGVCLHGSLRRQCETCDLADQLELADQRIDALTAERDDWRLSFETSNAHVGRLQEKVATLTARVQEEVDAHMRAVEFAREAERERDELAHELALAQADAPAPTTE
jgi:chromosome segregation ATPase